MKESYLHDLWKHKKIPFPLLKLTTGENVTIKSCGYLNDFESGPDFIDGKIEINGITWIGNIEIHIKSSDWYHHKHHLDKAYDNVILHVVFEHDKEVIINNEILPTIELKKYIQEEMLIDHANDLLLKSEFLCLKQIPILDQVYFESMKSKAVVNRLNRKIASSLFRNETFDPQQLLYLLLARAFGTKVNAQPFEELARRIPIKILKKENSDFIETIIKNISGVYEIENSHHWMFMKMKYNFDELQSYIWKYKGLRPFSFPNRRILQFIKIIEKFDFETTFSHLPTLQLLDFLLDLLNVEEKKMKISNSMKDLIIINCFIPFLWWYGNIKMDVEIQEKSLDLLNYLKPEENHIVKKWKKIGVKCRNSYDSQALLEIYNEFCKVKRCHHCDVGIKILET